MDKNNALHIKNLQISDSGSYRCRVLPEDLNLNISLKVSGPVTHAKITANGFDISGKKLTYDIRKVASEFVGDNLRIKCETSGGYPPARITWSHNNKALAHGAKLHHYHVYNDTLEIRHITRKQGGIYKCEANNGYKKNVHASTDLIVTRKDCLLQF